MKVLALLLALSSAGAIAYAQATPEDHSAHHPAEGAPAATASQAPSASSGDQARFEQQMKMMQDMHQRMLAAKTPRERTALMDEHMKLMQSGMEMMDQMRQGSGMGMGMGMMGGATPTPPGAGQQQPGSAAAMGGMMPMMDMHAQMERRMAMMQMMMQMMVDREAATHSK